MTLKVYHVVRQYHPSIGGLEDVVYNIAQQQLKSGTQVPTVITLDRLFRGNDSPLPQQEVLEGVEVRRYPYFGSDRYPVCWQILQAIREADVVHVHGVDFFFDFLSITRFWHRKPLLACSHGIFFHTPFASRGKLLFFNSVTRLSALAYQHIFATSANDGRLFSRICAGDKVTVIENGVNVDKFRLPHRQQSSKTIIYFGRWAENKGLPATLRMFRSLWQQDSEWRLILAGREYDHSAAELHAEAHRLGVSEVVRIVPNPEQNELKSLMNESSYFICQSRHEGFGLAAIEAMSAGLIPLLSPIPPFARLVEETGQGLLLEGSDKTIVDAVCDLHESVSADYPMVTARVVRSIQHYSWSHVADRYMEAYARVAAADKPMEQVL